MSRWRYWVTFDGVLEAEDEEEATDLALDIAVSGGAVAESRTIDITMIGDTNGDQ